MDEAALIKELNELSVDAPAPKPKIQVSVDQADEPDKPVADEVVEDEDGEAPLAPAEDEEADEPPAEEAVEEEEQLDPRTAKALAARQRDEKRRKQEHSQRVAELREIESDIRRQASELRQGQQRLESLKAAAMEDPVAFYKELGFTEADFEDISKQFYFASPKAKENPKLKETADAYRRRLSVEGKLSQAIKKIEELEARENARQELQHRETVINEYLSDVVKVMDGEKTPLVAAWSTKAPIKFRQKLREKAEELAMELGYVPEPDEVMEALEHSRRAELEEVGIPLDSVIKPKKTTEPTAGGKQKRPTLSSDMSTPKSKATFKSRDDEIEDVRIALERGVLD